MASRTHHRGRSPYQPSQIALEPLRLHLDGRFKQLGGHAGRQETRLVIKFGTRRCRKPDYARSQLQTGSAAAHLRTGNTPKLISIHLDNCTAIIQRRIEALQSRRIESTHGLSLGTGSAS